MAILFLFLQATDNYYFLFQTGHTNKKTLMAHQVDQKWAQYTNQDDRCSTQVYYIPLPNMGTSLNHVEIHLVPPCLLLMQVSTFPCGWCALKPPLSLHLKFMTDTYRCFPTQSE